MSKCPPEYRNLGLLSFSEQRYVTVEMLKQMCKNDEYLKQNLDKLEYLTPPAIRKRYSPANIDLDNSFGCMVGDSENVVFDTLTELSYHIDFSNVESDKYIDDARTTAMLKSGADGLDANVRKVQTPTILKSTINRETKDQSPWPGHFDLQCNEHWYIGFDKNREYHIQPNWLFEENIGKGDDNGEIPSIGRAQTFQPAVSGFLEGVTVNLKCDKDKFNTASPLIVQIRKTVEKDGVAYPANYVYNKVLLAEEKVRFLNSTPDICTITFKNPAYVEAGESYAVCFLSPLTHPSNAWHLGGWSKNCGADPYEDGDAFYTYNNGASWIRYGKGDETVDYSQGRCPPQDFAFEMQIREEENELVKDTNHWVYLKPFRSNPVRQVGIYSVNNNGDDGAEVEFQVSNNGRKWHDLENNHTYTFASNGNSDDFKEMTFVRARLKSTTDTPAHINDITVTLHTIAPTRLYARTHFYYPKPSGMLGASVWGRIAAPFETEINNKDIISCEAEIISEKEAIEHFTVINVSDVVDYIWIDGIEESKVVDKTEKKIAEYLIDTPSAINALKEQNVYVLPWFDENEDEYVYFFNYLEFINEPAYPILSCTLQPTATGEQTINYGEWYEFIYNYDDFETMEETILEDDNSLVDYDIPPNCLLFYNDVLLDMPAGTFTITYNPLILSHLTNEEVGTNGLVLDYFQEEFEVDDELFENRSIQLRCSPVDPIRKVVVNQDSDNRELIEDYDFTVNYDTRTVTFVNGVLTNGDKVKLVYTPNIEDTGLAIGYYAKRDNTDLKLFIKPNWFEYKT